LAAKTGLIFVWPEIIRGQLTLKIKKKLKKKKKKKNNTKKRP
jgi:hypothetical protein